ncbi:MAG: phosphoribosylformylglycinamidine synthase subunit PurS [Gammaproteobacteria bacterium]|nr:phosphoribosylformylglycinamidine synthase subunit PurS [Gammaproteobacteria bacterium]
MSAYAIEIRVTPRRGLLDPQGKAIQHALDSLGFAGVGEVRAGKLLVIELDADSPDEAAARATRMCEKLLANPVTEDFAIEVGRNAGQPEAAT